MASLNGATAPGPGTATDFVRVRKQFRMAVSITGNAASVLVNLEGSVDGSTWTTLVSSTNTVGESVLSLDGEVRFVRANLVAIATAPGGTAPAVTAAISAAGPY